MKIKQASLTLKYNVLQKRITDLETYVKQSLPNFDYLQVITERVNEIADQTTGLTEAVAGAKFSNMTPIHPSCQQHVQKWQQRTQERN
jgi:hypothetical protein